MGSEKRRAIPLMLRVGYMTGKLRDDLKGKVLRLDGLVEYQDGAIASRMIVNNPAGNITIFSFDEGEGLSEHTAPYDAVLTVLEGESGIRLAGEEMALHAGETIILPANVPHAVAAVTRFKMMLTMIRGGEGHPEG